MRRPEAALPRVVVLVAYYSARRSSTTVSPLVVVEACGTTRLASNCLMVLIY